MPEDQLPLYLGRRPSGSTSPPLDDDPRQSFPATVRERDSFASTWTGIQSERQSVRGPPPPLPPKPPKQHSWSSVVHPPVLQSSKSTSDSSSSSAGSVEAEPEGGQEESPDPQGSPSQWLDIMLGHSEAQQAAPTLSRTTSTSSPFPTAPRLPPRPPPRSDDPPSNPLRTRIPSPSIQLTPSATPPTSSHPAPALPARRTDASPSRPPPSRQPQPSTSSTTLSSTSSSTSPMSSSPSTGSTSAVNSTSALNTIGAGIQHLKLKDRLAAGVGFGREWGGKGKEKLQEGWRVGSAAVGRPSNDKTTLGSSPTDDSAFAAGHARARSSSPLPSAILGHRLPKNPPHLAFGLPLVEVVEATRVQDIGGAVHRKKDDDAVTGDEARRWLPSVAFRSLQYLEEWGKTEEGVYR